MKCAIRSAQSSFAVIFMSRVQKFFYAPFVEYLAANRQESRDCREKKSDCYLNDVNSKASRSPTILEGVAQNYRNLHNGHEVLHL